MRVVAAQNPRRSTRERPELEDDVDVMAEEVPGRRIEGHVRGRP